ncbi:MAG: ABC transporter substrate-binding protein [Albidovulum sp.]|nr:ABC transporter substrate-binding protein [Albidovulum sp.]
MRKTLLMAFATALAAGPAQPADKTLTISVYGFNQDTFEELLYAPFEEICGCEIVVETGNSVERLAKIEANAADPVIDMAVISTHDALAASRKGLLQPIDVAKLSNYGKLYDFAKDPLGDNLAVGYTFYATSIVYRSDQVAIDSWGDLLSEDVAGFVAFPDITTTQAPISLYMLGKALGDDSPSMDAPISAIGDKSENFVTYYARSSQLAQLFQQEEVYAAPVGRFAWSRFAGSELPIAWATPSEGQTGGVNVMIMTKDNGNEELALEFMDYWLSTEVQTRLAEALVDSPANSEVVVSDEAAANLSYGADLVDSLNMLEPSVILHNREHCKNTCNQTVIQ